MTNKSAHHLRLEQALKENKEAIFRLPTNSSMKEKLRKEAVNLRIELTSEIRREFKDERALCKS